MTEKKNDCLKEKMDWERGVIRKIVDNIEKKMDEIGQSRDTKVKLSLLKNLADTAEEIDDPEKLVENMAFLQISMWIMAESRGRTEQFEAEVTRILAVCERDLKEGYR